MTNKSEAAYLGQEVFFILKGEIARTIVGSVSREGHTFLDSRCPHENHWFSFDQAVEAAEASLKRRQETLRKQIRALDRKRKIQKTQLYQKRVMRDSRRVEDLRGIDQPLRARYLKNILVPESYLSPGQVVYLAVGPLTRTADVPLYRPYNYFVLETEVREVTFDPTGTVHYSLAAPFAWYEFFPTRKKAEDSLRTDVKLQSSEVVHFVSKVEYQTEYAKMDTAPF